MAKPYSGFTPDEALGSIQSSGPCLPVVEYDFSREKNTKNDVLEGIINLKSINPNAKVILRGHSQGKDVVKIATERQIPTFKPDPNKPPFYTLG